MLTIDALIEKDWKESSYFPKDTPALDAEIVLEASENTSCLITWKGEHYGNYRI